MTYEIRTLEKICGKTYKKSYLTNEYKHTTCKKGNCISFKVEGKKSATYVFAERKRFHEEFETVITEATTGRVIERFA